MIDTTGGAVPTDLIKTLWVNGQPVPARIEFASTQRYDVEQVVITKGHGQAKPAKPVKGPRPAKGVRPAKTAKSAKNASRVKSGKRAASAKSAAEEQPPADDEPAAGDEPAGGDEMAVSAEPRRGRDRNAAKQTTISFVISGQLKPGLNWLAFPADLQNVYGMRMAVPAGLGWSVPLPKLDFSGKLDAIVWAEPLSRLNGPGLVRRGQLTAPPADATVLARFSDGLPAVARVGNVTFATSDQSRDWSRWIEDAVRIDWAITKENHPTYGDSLGMHNANHASGDPVQADGAQVAASLLRHPQAGTRPEILAVDRSAVPAAADGGAVLRLVPVAAPRLLSYQFRNWLGMLLDEGRVTVPANVALVVLAAPSGDPSPLTTHLRADRWLRAALLDNDGASVRDYLEARWTPFRRLRCCWRPATASSATCPRRSPVRRITIRGISCGA